MIVINKRYYDYDYDNNTIIMFDADDESESALQMASNPLADKKLTHSSSISGQLESQSQSTETVPDELLIKVPSTSSAQHADSGRNDNDHNDEEEALQSQASHDEKEKEKENDSGIGSVSWISSASPKGSRRIPYAIQIAHSYTINKLEVQLTTLVDVATIHKQQQQQLLALQQQQQQYQQALQREHEALIAQQQQHEFQRRYYRSQQRGRDHPAYLDLPPLPPIRPPVAVAVAVAVAPAAPPHPPSHHVAMHPAHVHAQQRARYAAPRELGQAFPAYGGLQILPDGIAYREPQRYAALPPRPGHTMRPVMVQKDRYHAK